ncbi:Gfo/Idh/MocA family protein [Paenibacillus sp. DMB20]|uniref:Gfo/Idh/MocA family protein n=1 Tax=Paenibacillus sp. DMB20 TaxID=1642570 RepID=UPI000628269A|nr:Gfo/Idh/MocA family oxidoreductase [Paenibacillus sp. DMB20]KKO52918.1 oxidoreductase [Paenibacillus sp. DMB20]KKO53603.1 oxidoreductase [Paenibacillus sp. DMB20]
MSKLKIGIIGCGGIANAKHLPALSKLSELAEMTAFCDIIIERAELAAKQYGAAGAKTYTDYRQLIQDGQLDVVHVLTPNSTHSVITVEALEAGKHVMCEKPMAINSLEAKSMLDAAKRTGKKLTIGYQNRFREDALMLKEACEDGFLGDIYLAKAHAVRRRAVPTWGVFMDKEKQGGGPLIDIGTHALDLTLWYMNNYKVKSVSGTAFQKLKDQNQANLFGKWDPNEFEVEDSAVGFIKMENGATIFLESSWALNTLDVREAMTSLFGTRGGAEMRRNPADGNPALHLNTELYGKLVEIKPEMNASIPYYGSKVENEADREARQWLEAILGDKALLVNPEEAYVVTRILEAIYESSRTGQEIILN